jgi:hypothetical protein
MFVSMMAIATVLFSKVVGYHVEDLATGKIEYFYFDDGYSPEDKPESTDDISVKDEMRVPQDTLDVFGVITQVMMLVVLGIFPYNILWDLGNRDDTKVRYKGRRPDPWRGYRIGALAAIPFAALWLLLLLHKLFGIMPDGYVETFRWLNIPFMPYVNWLTSMGDIQNTAVWQIMLLLPLVLYLPIVCGVSYKLGHKQFSIREHLVFAKKEEKNNEEI